MSAAEQHDGPTLVTPLVAAGSRPPPSPSVRRGMNAQLFAIQAATGIGGLAAFTLALFAISRGIRADTARRMDRFTLRLEKRIRTLERRLDRAERRRYQLEAILRAAGIELPPWPLDHDPDPDQDDIELLPSRRLM